MVAGKDGNPLNEVELMSDALMNDDGVLRGNNVIKLAPAESGLKLKIGDRIKLSATLRPCSGSIRARRAGRHMLGSPPRVCARRRGV
jgi:hypothetical protein